MNKKLCKPVFLAASLSLALLATACASQPKESSTSETTVAASETEKETEATETEVAEEEIDYANMTAEDLIKDMKGEDWLSAEQFEWLVSTYRYVSITEDLDLNSNITDDAFSLLKESDVDYKCTDESLKTLLSSKHNQIRGKAYDYIRNKYGSLEEETKKFVKEAIKSEKEPFVLNSALLSLSNEADEDEDIKEFLLNMSKHENKYIRINAAYGIGILDNKGVEEYISAMLELVNDEDEDVVDVAARNCGVLADERFVEPLKAILADDSKEWMHKSAVGGLVDMWWDFPFHDNVSEAAYRATMDYYKKTPRTEKVPSWAGISIFGSIGESEFEDWKSRAAYYNPDEIVTIMTELIQDPNVHEFGREAAIEIIKVHGTAEQFAALKGTIEALTDENASRILEEYNEQAANQ